MPTCSGLHAVTCDGKATCNRLHVMLRPYGYPWVVQHFRLLDCGSRASAPVCGARVSGHTPRLPCPGYSSYRRLPCCCSACLQGQKGCERAGGGAWPPAAAGMDYY